MLVSVPKIISNPITFFALFLSTSIFYFADLNDWWGYQLALQILISVLGFIFIPPCRSVAVIFLVGSVVLNFSWFSISPEIPESCGDQIDSVTGIATIGSKTTRRTLGMVQVEINCKRDSARRMLASVSFEKRKPGRMSWFRAGDRIRLYNVRVSQVDRFSFQFTPVKRFRVYNLTRQKNRLNRGRLVLYIQAKARYFLGAFTNAIYKAMVTADRSDITRDWSRNFQRLGISHLFAISGLHVGLIYFWLYWALRVIFIPFSSWLNSGKYLIFIDILCVVLIFQFLIVIGMPISAKRAFIMLCWLLMVKWFFHWQPLWFVLLGTACLITLESPVAIGQLSFQLSFLSVAGIIQIMPLLPKRVSQQSILKSVIRVAITSIMISGWLFLLNFPLINQMYNTFSFITVINNLAHIMFFSVVFLPFALLVLGLTIISYPFGGFPGEYWVYTFLNIIGKCWEWLLAHTISVNSPFLFTWKLSWQWYQYTAYWLVLAGISFGTIYWLKLKK